MSRALITDFVKARSQTDSPPAPLPCSSVDRLDPAPACPLDRRVLAADGPDPDEAAWVFVRVLPRRAGGVALQKVVAGDLGLNAAELRIDRDVPVRAEGRRIDIAVVAEYVIAFKITGAEAVNTDLIIRNNVVVNRIATIPPIDGRDALAWSIVRYCVLIYLNNAGPLRDVDTPTIRINEVVAYDHVRAHTASIYHVWEYRGNRNSRSLITPKDVLLDEGAVIEHEIRYTKCVVSTTFERKSFYRQACSPCHHNF